ncbi:MAG TPA: LysR family transcriptional regulator [Enterobacteriaceae bacterium]|nr:LysR family transcriptional regulator [Enterobacteriaceae bacterium]
MNSMHPVLRRLDLNLLPVFDAVFRHGSVRLAAEELAMSTSALSHALARLRMFLNDPLFYREGHHMRPSVYANQLAPEIAAALESLNRQLSPQPRFVPQTSDICFNIAITDYTAFSVFPALMRDLQHAAPNLRFDLQYLPHNPALKELLAGEVDLALGFSTPEDEPYAELRETDWFEDEYVVISNANRTHLTFEDYLAARHLVVTPWNEKKGVIDLLLERQGHQRHVTIKTPSMLGGPFIVAESELLMTIPRYAAKIFQPTVPVTVFEMPFNVPSYCVKMYSHRRSGKKEAADWLQNRLSALAATFPACER